MLCTTLKSSLRAKHIVTQQHLENKTYLGVDQVFYQQHKELSAGWSNGVMLLLVPDEIRFYAQPEDVVGGFVRFLARVLPYRTLITEALLVNLVVGLLSLASPLLIQILTDEVLVRGDTHLLTVGISSINCFQYSIRSS